MGGAMTNELATLEELAEQERFGCQPQSLTFKDAGPDILSLFGALASMAGTTVTARTVLGVATAFSCVNIIARYIAKLPLQILSQDESREPALELPIYHILNTSPNKWQTSYEFRMMMQANLSLRGNAFAEIIRRRGTVVEIIPIEVPAVRLDSSGDYIVEEEGEGSRVVRRRNMIHLRGLSLAGLFGLDPIHIGKEIFGLSIALDDNASKFFSNSSRPGAVLEAPRGINDETYAKLQEAFDANSSGANAYKTVILEHGLKYALSRIPNDAAQFDQSRDRQAIEIARFFGVPGHKVGISTNMPRANVQEQNIEFVTDTIGPITCCWEQHLERKLLNRRERDEFQVKFDIRGAVRGNIRDQVAYYTAGRQLGFLNTNDIRRMENLPSIGPDGDSYDPPRLGGGNPTDGNQSDDDGDDNNNNDDRE